MDEHSRSDTHNERALTGAENRPVRRIWAGVRGFESLSLLARVFSNPPASVAFKRLPEGKTLRRSPTKERSDEVGLIGQLSNPEWPGQGVEVVAKSDHQTT